MLKADSKKELQRGKIFKSTCHETNFFFFNVVLFVSETKGKILELSSFSQGQIISSSMGIRCCMLETETEYLGVMPSTDGVPFWSVLAWEYRSWGLKRHISVLLPWKILVLALYQRSGRQYGTLIIVTISTVDSPLEVKRKRLWNYWQEKLFTFSFPVLFLHFLLLLLLLNLHSCLLITGTHYVVQGGLKLKILLAPLCPKCWEDRCIPLYPAQWLCFFF